MDPKSGQETQNEDGFIDEVVKNIDKKVIERLKADAQRKHLSILIVGRTGVGKSSTINSMMGEQVAEVGEFTPVTTEVKPFHSKINDVPYSVYDTPGLCDALPEKGKDDVYLERIIKGVPYVDCMIYVSRLDDNRASADEIRGIKLVTQAFGPDVWKRAVIVFTHADKVDTDKLTYRQDGRTKVFRDIIGNPDVIGSHVPARVVNKIPSVRVTNISLLNPDNEYWLTNLFTTVFDRMEVDGQRALFMLTAHRIVEIDEDREFVTPGQEEPDPPRYYGSGGGTPTGSGGGKPTPQSDAPPAIVVPKHWTDGVVKRIPELKPIVDGYRKVEQKVKEVASSVKQSVGNFFRKLFG